jgi:hypothetical protein
MEESMNFIYNIDGSEIDVFPVFIEIISINQMLYPKIDEIYEKDKFQFYSNATASLYYEYHYFKNSSIEKEIYAKRILGILVSAINENDNNLMSEISELREPIFLGFLLVAEKNMVNYSIQFG